MLTRRIALLMIVVSIIIAWLIANVSVNYNSIELGALINILGPLFIGIGTLIAFLLLDWIFPKAIAVSAIIFSVVNIIAGIQIRMDSACC